MNKKMFNILFVVSLLLLLFTSRAVTTAGPAERSPAEPVHNLANRPTEGPSVGTKLFDVLIVRPVSLGAAAVSTGICVATLPFTFPAGISEKSARVLVEAPWRFAGGRYMGEWNHYKDEKPITVIECCDSYNEEKVRMSSGKTENEDRDTTENPELVTLSGYNAKNNTTVHGIYLWRELNHPLAGVNAVARHGEQVKLIKQDGVWVLVETLQGRRGWTKKGFISEIKNVKNDVIFANNTGIED